MTAADFWAASPRAIMALYDCAKQARKTPQAVSAKRSGPSKEAPQRLSRLPH